MTARAKAVSALGSDAAPAHAYEDSDLPPGLGVSLSLRNRRLAPPAMLRACAPDALDTFLGPWAGGFAAVDAAAAVPHRWLTAQS